MRDEIMAKVFPILNDYVNIYRDKEYVDYYGIFKLDESLSYDQLVEYINGAKLLRFFHPDHVKGIDGEFMRDAFLELADHYHKGINLLLNKEQRQEYDKKLALGREKEKLNNTNNSTRQSHQDTGNSI